MWKVNTSGNFVSSIKAKLWEDEEKFNQDINGDSDTGLVSVEATGNAYLKHGDNTYNGAPQYYIVDDTDTNIVSSHIGLTRGGEKGPTSYTGWSASQVEKNGSHYEVLWTNPTGKKYDVWQVNTSGNFVSSIKAKLWEDEEKFNQDINGDSDTGLVSVEATGNAYLKHGDNTYNGAPQYYIVDDTDTNIVSSHIGLTRGGEKGPTSYTGWSASQVEKNGSHYEVLWTNPTGKKYDVWQVNTSGNFVSSIKAKLWEDEEKFNQDINGDGDTGLVSVEATGNAYLKHGDNTYNGAPQYYIVDDTDTNIVSSHIGLTRGGEKGPTSYTGWSASQVEKNGSHYEVLWTNPTGKKYDVWQVNTSGNFVSSIKAKLWEDEEKFNQDINGDGDTGLVSVQAIGAVHLKHGDNTYNGAPQYYIVDGTHMPLLA